VAPTNEKQTCRKLYSQVINGYTPALLDKSKVFIKHFSDSEFSSFEEEYEEFFEGALNKGLSSEKEKLEEVILQEHWSEEEEQQIKDLAGSISDATRQLETAPLEQREGVRSFVQSLQNKFHALGRVRNELIGTTAETYAQRKNNERIIFHSLYKDLECKATFFEEEEFEELDQSGLVEAISLYNGSMEFFTEKWIKKIATMPSFLNSFFLCNDDPSIYYGKPVVDLTIYQTDLFSKGKYFKSILSESAADGPSEADYEKGMQGVVNWYDLQYSIIRSKRDQEASQASNQSNQQPARSRGRR